MLTRIFIIGLVYTIIGLIVALLHYYVFKKQFVGNLTGVLIVALFGAFLGGVCGVLFEEQLTALSRIGNVNIVPPLLISLLLVWIFSKLGHNH